MSTSEKDTTSVDSLKMDGIDESLLNLPEPMVQVKPATEAEEVIEQAAIIQRHGATPSVGQLSATSTLESAAARDRHVLQRSHSSVSMFGLPFSLHNTHTSLGRNAPADHARDRPVRNKSFVWTRTSSSSKSSSTINSPEIQAMIKGSIVPDLEAVNKALTVVSNSSDSSEEHKIICVKQLGALAADIEAAHRDGKKLLNEAMQARSAGKAEICRAKCVQIVRSAAAANETKIYANNILSTLASVGRAEDFLDRSVSLLVKSRLGAAEKDQMLGCIAVLRESARNKEGATRLTTKREELAANDASEEWAYGGDHAWRRGVRAEVAENDALHLCLSDATMDGIPTTPRMEKIIQWAGEGEKGQGK